MLTNNLRNYIAACFSGLWIETFEPDEAIREIETLCDAESWSHTVWDISVGDPLTAVKSAETLGDGETPQLIVLRNFHRFLGSIEVVQAVEQQIQRGKTARTFLVVLAPVVQIPVELEKLFVVVEHPLPDKDQLRQIATDIAGELADEPNTTRVIEAAAGLTRMEAEGAFSLSLIEHDALLPEPIWTLKANLLRQSSALRLYRGEIPTLGGLDNLASFCTRALSGNGNGERAKGVMLLGVSGSGKSAYAKRLGHSVHRPTLILDIGSLMGSLVGQTEAALRKALKQIDAMSPCVVMIDDVEKAIASGGNDGGVSTRLLGTLLTWLNDRTSDSFIVCTANDIAKLPPEFTRSERFDGIFFVDLPDATAREQIWRIYERQYGFENPQRPDDNDWTGAEIKSCCRLAKLLDVSLQEAALNVVPVSATASESIETLRRWASGRCLDSALPGTYLHRPRATQRRNLGSARNDGPPRRLSDAWRSSPHCQNNASISDEAVGGEECQVVFDGGGDYEPIRRIAVHVERAATLGDVERDRQHLKPSVIGKTNKILFQRTAEIHAVLLVQHRNLPKRNCGVVANIGFQYKLECFG